MNIKIAILIVFLATLVTAAYILLTVEKSVDVQESYSDKHFKTDWDWFCGNEGQWLPNGTPREPKPEGSCTYPRSVQCTSNADCDNVDCYLDTDTTYPVSYPFCGNAPTGSPRYCKCFDLTRFAE